MKKILISLFLLFCLTGCSSLSQLPFIGVEKNIDEEVLYSKMNIPETVSFEIEDIGQEQWSSETEKDYTLYFKKMKIPEYNISIQYMSPTSGIYDYKYATWVNEGILNPQGRPTIEFSERKDFKEFKPCFFSPITLYGLSGSLEEMLIYFESQDNVKYTNILQMEEDMGYWSKIRGTTYIWGKNIVEDIRLGTIKFYKWDGPIDWKNFPANGIWQRYIIYNTETPNWIYKIDVRGEDCAGYPNLSVIDFIE